MSAAVRVPDALTPVPAHLGGVPEAMTVILPVAIFAGFLLMERRARRREREAAELREELARRDKQARRRKGGKGGQGSGPTR